MIFMDCLGLYVHVPFCAKKCKYCDFKSYSNFKDNEGEYFDALVKEIEKAPGGDRPVDTVFFGGGTPSLANPKNIDRAIRALYSRYRILSESEITIEVNPGTVSADMLKLYFSLGINRLSIGLQSADEKELKALGRIHTFKDYEVTLENAVKAGFKNISTDIMFGIPLQTEGSFEKTVENVGKYPITHISAYGLIIEEETEFYNMYASGLLELPDEAEERRMYHRGISILEGLGYKQYEISNFAQKGFECRHNLKYWRAEEYIGFGCAAHSYFSGRRYGNTDTISGYIEDMNKKGHSGIPYEDISKEESMKEYMMLGLRLSQGVCDRLFKERYGESIFKRFKKEIFSLMLKGIVEKKDDCVRLTEKGLDFANLAFMEFI